jgi:hypothetical protein
VLQSSLFLKSGKTSDAVNLHTATIQVAAPEIIETMISRRIKM